MISVQLITQLLLLAVFLSINNFVIAIGLGFSHVWKRMRFKIAIIFGIFDFAAPLVGLYIGSQAANLWGNIIGFVGVLIILFLGVYLIFDGLKQHNGMVGKLKSQRLFMNKLMISIWAIVAIAFSVSFDNFVVGFGLGTLHAPILVTAVVFGLVTFLMALLGIAIGGKVRLSAEGREVQLASKGGIITGLVFMVVALWKLLEVLQIYTTTI
jgi:putative Mn2+ efflux pump MntP